MRLGFVMQPCCSQISFSKLGLITSMPLASTALFSFKIPRNFLGLYKACPPVVLLPLPYPVWPRSLDWLLLARLLGRCPWRSSQQVLQWLCIGPALAVELSRSSIREQLSSCSLCFQIGAQTWQELSRAGLCWCSRRSHSHASGALLAAKPQPYQL